MKTSFNILPNSNSMIMNSKLNITSALLPKQLQFSYRKRKYEPAVLSNDNLFQELNGNINSSDNIIIDGCNFTKSLSMSANIMPPSDNDFSDVCYI